MTFKQMQDMLDLMVEAKWQDRGANRFPPTLVKILLNNAHQYISAQLAWNRGTETVDISADTREYAVGSTEREWLAVVYVDDSADTRTPLEHVSLGKFLEVDQCDETSGRPDIFCRHGNQLMLWPTPDDDADTVTVYYVADTADLSADDDTPTYPPHLHNELIQIAWADAHHLMGEVELGSSIRLQAQATVERQRHLPAMSRSGGRITNRSSI